MTLAKRLLLGTAAAFVATSGAQAADLGLPVAPSVDYVQICSIGSFTGFLLPGGDVCFDISGFARAEYTWGEEIDPFAYTLDTTSSDLELELTAAALDTMDVEYPAGTNISTAVATGVADADLLTNLQLIGLVGGDATSRTALATASNSRGYASSVAVVGNIVRESTGGADTNMASGGPLTTENNLLVLDAVAGFSQGDVLIGYGALYNGFVDGTEDDELDFLGRGQINFDARTMTEYGLLRAFVRIDGENGTQANVDHAYVQMNIGSLGFTAGRAASVFDPVFTGYGPGARNDLMLNDSANEQFSVNAAVGNGVTVSLSVEDERATSFLTVAEDMRTGLLPTYTFGTATTDSGQSIPDLIAAIRVDQAWGSAKLTGVMTELNPTGSTYDSEFGYALGASAEFNLPVGVGSTFGIAGIYSHGANGYLGFNNTVGNTATSNANAILVSSTTDGTNFTYSTELATSYVIAAGFNFGLSDMVSLSIDGAYADIDHDGTVFDGNVYTIRGGIEYTPVNNLTIAGGVTYTASDFNTDALRSGTVDDDEWSARLRITRSF